jgi:prevent-host-death family protein
MLQIVNVTDARNNFAKLIQTVKANNEPVVIVQDSTPAVVIYPYNELAKKEEEKEQFFKLRFQQVFDEGEKAFTKYLKKNKLPRPSTEEEAYELIKNA